MLRKIKKFYRPNIINISMSFICLGLVWLIIIPLIGSISMVPCKILDDGSWSLCPINPAKIVQDESIQDGAYYLGFLVGDYVYGLLFLAVFILVLPYTLSCLIFQLYYKYIKKIVNK